jgi:hypothetical protein
MDSFPLTPDKILAAIKEKALKEKQASSEKTKAN